MLRGRCVTLRSMFRQVARLAGIGVLTLLFVACRHDWPAADEFARAVQCGMSEEEIRRIANERFDVRPDYMRRQHTPNILTVQSRDLDFVDILLQGGEAVAVQRGNHVAFTTSTEFGEIRMLCGAIAISESRLRDYDPK